jgi:hypothetical protein
MSTVCAGRSFIRDTVSLLGIVSIAILASSAQADCTGSLSLAKVSDPSRLLTSIEGESPLCRNSPVDLLLSTDGSPFSRTSNCPTSPCSAGPYTNWYSCLRVSTPSR